jgi:uncharacterized protein (DUF2141 family)
MRTYRTALVIAGLLSASAAIAAPLKVSVRGISKLEGQLAVQVVNSAEAYAGKSKAVSAERLSPNAAQHEFNFDLPPGRYAVMVMHDENGNGKLDSNVIGIPTEGYGFSNNPRVMRRPTFDETGFELDNAGSQIDIDLN